MCGYINESGNISSNRCLVTAVGLQLTAGVRARALLFDMLHGYINKKGNYVIEPLFDAADDFSYYGLTW